MELLTTLIVAILGGATASIAGFGIGSLLTPLVALYVAQTKVAVVLVSVPHFIATAWRCWLLRDSIDKNVLLHFGIASAVGGLCGALFAVSINNKMLGEIFGNVLVFAGVVGLLGLNERVRMPKWLSWVAGAVSGGLGGLVGNQGGIRSAALLAFKLDKIAFVATATAIGVVVDLVRMPVYFYRESAEIMRHWQLLAAACTGVLLGTAFGIAFLKCIPQKPFRKIVSLIIIALGAWMLRHK